MMKLFIVLFFFTIIVLSPQSSVKMYNSNTTIQIEEDYNGPSDHFNSLLAEEDPDDDDNDPPEPPPSGPFS